MREKFDSPGMGVHVALQCTAFQGELLRVRCLPATWLCWMRQTAHPRGLAPEVCA
jgi:hypothetical protein